MRQCVPSRSCTDFLRHVHTCLAQPLIRSEAQNENEPAVPFDSPLYQSPSCTLDIGWLQKLGKGVGQRAIGASVWAGATGSASAAGSGYHRLDADSRRTLPARRADRALS